MDNPALQWSGARKQWLVVYRHPALTDVATGAPGRRVRRPLGVDRRDHAETLVQHLQALLDDAGYWPPELREHADRYLDSRAVAAFYDPLTERSQSSLASRESALPLPAADTARRVLLLGTTGAGKTTLVRQLLGTHPRTERFPSTSTAKTTVADTELVLADGPFRAVVTFAAQEEVVAALVDNAVTAALSLADGDPDDVALVKLLDHVSQRFRFGYVLGRPPAPPLPGDIDIDFDLDDPDDEEPAGPPGGGDMSPETHAALVGVLGVLGDVARRHRDVLLSGGEEGQWDDAIEDALDTALRTDENLLWQVDVVLELLEQRFDLLVEGHLERHRSGWPLRWTWDCEDRGSFLTVISRFASNHAAAFGTLLTPLVDGLRVQGPFSPRWLTGPRPALVLLDGEGLGHTPSSSAALSTALIERLEDADVVLLVDNAAQPMQAAPIAAMKNIVTAGHAGKLVLLFTHFDQVKGDNLRGAAARRAHVLASATNVLTAIGEELGRFAERALRARVETATFFAGNLEGQLDASRPAHAWTIDQLQQLVGCLTEGIDAPVPTGAARPVYDRADLVLAVTAATQRFHHRWRAALGLTVDGSIPKEHWARVKALSRRLAEGWADEYQHLRPVASLRKELQDALYLMVQKPVGWHPAAPPEDEQQVLFDDIAQSLVQELAEMSHRRVLGEQADEWGVAFAQSGKGSATRRAQVIAHDIYEAAAPVAVRSATDDDLLREVEDVVLRTAAEREIALR